MFKKPISYKASQFTESVIREMTRLAMEHEAINLSQGYPDFPAPEILKKAASDAGKKAFIVNRVGDAGFLLGIFLTSALLGTIRFTEIGSALTNAHIAVGTPLITAIALLFFWRRKVHSFSSMFA